MNIANISCIYLIKLAYNMYHNQNIDHFKDFFFKLMINMLFFFSGCTSWWPYFELLTGKIPSGTSLGWGA